MVSFFFSLPKSSSCRSITQTTIMTRKRKFDSESHVTRKRLKLTPTSGSSQAVSVTSETHKIDHPIQVSKPDIQDTDSRHKDEAKVTDHLAMDRTKPGIKRRRINKLVPPRPFPTVPASVSATGPRSAHTEGKNYICLTRKTSLGAYMRRCKDVVLKDGCVLAPFTC
jgi:ribonuclease P/MRP protein subunit RPP20